MIGDAAYLAGVISGGLGGGWFLAAGLGPRVQTWPTRIGLTLGLALGSQTITGLVLARLGLWSPGWWALCSWLFLAFALITMMGSVSLNSQNTKPAIRGQGRALAGAVVVAAFFGCLWGSFAHEDLLGERDGGTYMSAAAELARSGDLGWPDWLASQFTMGRIWRCYEYLGTVFDHFPRFLLYPGFYVDEPELRIIPQFLGGYEPWLALALRAGNEPWMFRVNPVMMAIGLLVFFCATARLAGPRIALGSTFLLGCCMGVSWHARSTGNEAMTLPLIWGTVLAHGLMLAYPNRRGLPWLGMPLLVALGVLKLAGWLVFPVLALDLGWRDQRCPGRRGGLRRGFLVLVLSVALAATHAAAFAPHYLYGSYKHLLSSLGVPYGVLVIGAVAVVGAGWVTGWLLAKLTSQLRLSQRLDSVPNWAWMVLFVTMVLSGRLIIGMQRSAVDALDSIWSDGANLAELANYFPTGLSLFGLAGFGILAIRRRGSGRGVLVTLGLLAMYLILNRNLDAIHPWASRRWVPVVFPVVVLGLGFFAYGVMGFFPARTTARGSWGRMLPGVLIAVMGFWIFRPGLPLIVSRHGQGLQEAHQDLAEILGPSTVAFAIPSSTVRRWAPWQYGRFGNRSYFLHATENSWSRMVPVFRNLMERGIRVVYMTDYPPKPWTVDQGYLRYAGSVELTWRSQNEMVRALPPYGSVPSIQRIFLYEVTSSGLIRGWTAESATPPRNPVVRRAGWPLRIDSLPIPPEYEGMREGLEASGRDEYANQLWTMEQGRIYLTELLRSVAADPTTGTVHPLGYEFRLGLTAGPGRPGPLTIEVMADMAMNGREQLLWKGQVDDQWTTATWRVASRLLQEESHVEIRTLRPEAAYGVPPGKLGVRVGTLEITPVQAADYHAQRP